MKFLGTPAVTVTAATRSAMASLDVNAVKRVMITGDETVWEWQTGNFTARITADSLNGLYQPHATVAQTVGAWARVWDGVHGRPEWFGAVVGGADCYAAITAAIALCPVVVFSPGTYFTSATIKINRDWCGLIGAGCEYNATDNKVTRLLVTSGSLTALQVGPDSYPGSINSLQRGNFVEGIYVARSIVPVNASGARAISVQWTFRARFRQVKAEESEYGFYFYGTTQTFADDCFAYRSSAGSGGGSTLYRGFYIEGNSGLFAGGNASCYLSRCTAGVNGALSLTVCDGFYADNNFTDLYLHDCETVSTKTGINIQGNSSTGLNNGNTDLILADCINDANTVAGILLNNIGTAGSVEIRGGYNGPASGATAAIVITSCNGSVHINGGQQVMAVGSAVGVSITSSKNVNVHTQIINCSSTAVAATSLTGGVIAPIVSNNGANLSNAIVDLTTCTSVRVSPTFTGPSGSAPIGVKLSGTGNVRCEVNASGMDSGAITSGAVNKVTYNGTQVLYPQVIGTDNSITGVLSLPAVGKQAINAQTGTTYTPVIGDVGKLVTLSNASAITLTIPPNSSVAYAVGDTIDFAQIGAGQVTFAPGSGVTLNSTPGLKCRAQYSGATATKLGTDTWLIVGDLAA